MEDTFGFEGGDDSGDVGHGGVECFHEVVKPDPTFTGVVYEANHKPLHRSEIVLRKIFRFDTAKYAVSSGLHDAAFVSGYLGNIFFHSCIVI